MKGTQESINAIYDPYYDGLVEALEKTDYSLFSSRLEELMFYDFRSSMNILSRLGIKGTENILIPDITIK